MAYYNAGVVAVNSKVVGLAPLLFLLAHRSSEIKGDPLRIHKIPMYIVVM
jgi:hypothetical protein